MHGYSDFFLQDMILVLALVCFASANIVRENSSVLVITPDGSGSGVVICAEPGPIVLTNKHVIGNFSAAEITIYRNVQDVPVNVVKRFRAKDDDIACLVLHDKAKKWICSHLAMKEAEPGEFAYTWGFPDDKVSKQVTGAVLSAGYVSSSSKQEFGIDMHIHQGNSGGPVFLKREPNVVVGIIKSKLAPWLFEDEVKHRETIELLEQQTRVVNVRTTLPDGREVPELMDLIARMMKSWRLFHSSFANAVTIKPIRDFLHRANVKLLEIRDDKDEL
jgi:hypothetical protein